MHSPWVVVLLVPAIASASGTVINRAPDNSGPSAATLLPSSKVRLKEIDDALYRLEVRPTGGQVFLASGKVFLPFFLAGGVPAIGVGSGLGYLNLSVSSSDPGVGRVGLGIGAAVAVVGLAMLLVCTFKMIDHWIEEADGAPARNARIRELRTERQALQAH